MATTVAEATSQTNSNPPPPAISSTDEQPPPYSSRARLPSYADINATNTSSSTSSPELHNIAVTMARRRPTDPHPDDDPYLASLRAWAREKEYANDYYGGHKGAVDPDKAPNDPLKPLRWVRRKFSRQEEGSHAEEGRRPTVEERGTEGRRTSLDRGEVWKGDVDSRRVV